MRDIKYTGDKLCSTIAMPITKDAATKAYRDIENLLPKETVDKNFVFSEVIFIVPNAPRQKATETHINHLPLPSGT